MKIWKILSLFVQQKRKKYALERTQGMAELSVHREIIHRFNQLSQLKPGIKIGLYQEKYCQLGIKGIEMGQNEGCDL